MDKQQRQQKYNQVREMCEPINKAKNYAMRKMIETGKKMGKLRYLMLAVLFVFLFIYHFSFAIFTQLKMREKMARALALAMSVILVFTSVDITVFAARAGRDEQTQTQVKIKTVTGFGKLSDNILGQELMLGAEEADIVFPEKLTASILTKSAGETETTVEESTSAEETESTEPEESTDVEESESSEESTGDGESTSAEETESTGSEESTDVEETGNPEESTDAQESTGVEENTSTEEPESTEESAATEEPDAKSASIMNTLFGWMQPVKVYADELDESKEEIAVTWKLDETVSTGTEFDSTVPGNTFVYNAVLPDGYVLAEGVVLPSITVIIRAEKQNDFVAVVDGVTFKLHAEDGVLPEGAVLSVNKIDDEQNGYVIYGAVHNNLDLRVAESGENIDTDPVLTSCYEIKFSDYAGNDIGEFTDMSKVSVEVNGIALQTDKMEVYGYDAGTDSAEQIASVLDLENGQLTFDIAKNGVYAFVGMYEPELPAMTASKDEEIEYNYKVDKRTNTNFTRGEQIIFIPDRVGFSGNYSIGLPEASAILQYEPKPEKSNYYNKTNLNCYVSVKKRSVGFDHCEYGSLNENLTQYNCYYGGVKNLKGGVYDFVKILPEYIGTVRLTKDGRAWSGQKVTLNSASGGDTYLLSESGNSGVYKNGTVPVGIYNVYVNDKKTPYEITVNLNLTSDSDLKEEYVSGEKVYRCTYEFTENVEFSTLSVQMVLDGKNSTELNGISLNNISTGNVVYSAATDNNAWEKVTDDGVTEFYVPVRDENTLEIFTRRGATGVKWNANSDRTASKTIRYNTLSITTNLDGVPSSKPGKVEVRKDNEVIYTFGGEGVYKEAFLEGEEYDIFVNGEDTAEDISSADSDKVLDFVKYEVSITDEKPWTDAEVALYRADGSLATVLNVQSTNGNTVVYDKIWTVDDYNLLVDDMDTHKVLSGSGVKTASLNYYTAGVTVKGAPDEPVIVMTNGADNYTFTGSGENWTAEHVLINNGSDGIEKAYNVTVKNTVATENVSVSSKSKTAVLQFWKVNFYKETTLMRTFYVLDGSTINPYGKVKTAGYTFSCWSENKWSKDNAESGTAYDFGQKITRDVNLYANYEAPDIKIGSQVYTDTNGNMNGIGPWYRMQNLVISGFDPGSQAIKNIFITTTNTETIKLLDNTNITVKNGITNVGLSSTTTIVPTTDKVAITFNTPVSMAEAQDFLRNKVVIQPVVGKEHTVIVEVTDASGKYVAINGVTAGSTSESISKLTSTNYGKTLSTGYYYITDNVTFNGINSGVSGLSISGTVYIYIPKGKTLTAIGGAGSGRTTGGGAGIYLPSGSKLILLGEGTVSAQGGRAASGQSGYGGNSSSYSGKTFYVGSGGSGGYGGAGAGAGIGTTGAYGGSGGSGGSSYSTDGDGGAYGNSGSSGSSGSTAGSMGTLYTAPAITVKATGGSAGYGGSGGSNGGTSWTNWSSVDRGAAGGAGGGGGGGGYAAADIGTGGRGGAGGGGGASAGYIWGGYYVGGGGGGAGYGGYNGSGGYAGSDGKIGNYSFDNNKQYATKYGSSSNGGVNGGGGGADALVHPKSGSDTRRQGGSGGNGGGTYSDRANTSGKANTYTSSLSEYKSFTISFQTTTDAAAAPDSIKYELGKSQVVSLPEYVDSDENVVFYGWQIKTAAKSGTSGSPLTTADSTRYQAGSTYTLDPTTVGNIVFVAITETIGGIKDNDTSRFTVSSTNKETYYTYNVELTLDGERVTKGTIKIGSDRVAPSTDGIYTIISKSNTVKNIEVNGSIVGTTADFDSSNVSTTKLAFESVQVSITGKMPKSVRLAGTGAPAISMEDAENTTEPYVYTAERLSQNDKGDFDIIVDGENVGKSISWGEKVDVAFYTVNLTVNTKGVDTDSIKLVELRDVDGNVFLLEKTGKAESSRAYYTITKLESNVEYTLYINGEKLDNTVSFSKNSDITVDYNRYVTVVTTSVDGKLTDMGTVKFGDETMVRIKTGTYRITTRNSDNAVVTVDGKQVLADAVPGTSNAVNYYTITYSKSGLAGSKENGALPQDETRYLENSEVVLKGQSTLTNGQKTFGGWKYAGKVYGQGDKIIITGKTTVTAEWNRTDMSSANITLSQDKFTYNGNSQAPVVTVVYNGMTLTEGEDYVITYDNTNKDAGRYDTAGSLNNAINAGTVTISVKGQGDYSGMASAEYTIGKKTLSAQNLKAVDRTYDGTTVVELITDDVILNGVIDGDDVKIMSGAIGRTYTADAGDSRYVQIEATELSGAMASNYVLEPLESDNSIFIKIGRKPLSDDMFKLSTESVVYNGAEQEPQVSATDMADVEGISKNIIDASDYIVTYSGNVHTGEATVTITASESGNYAGTVTKHFNITRASLEVTATDAQSVYGEEVADVSGNYKILSGRVFTDEDMDNLCIRAVTSVKRGYDAKKYTGAVTIAYHSDNQDYDVTIKSADYTVTPASVLDVSGKSYAGVYDGENHSIEVTAKTYKPGEQMTVYYSTAKPLNAGNYRDGSTDIPVFRNAGTYTVYYYAVSDNYTGAAGQAVVSISKAPLVITAKPHTITYGENAASIAEKDYDNIAIDGLVQTDTAENVLKGTLSYISKNYAKYDNVGTYTLIPQGLTADNYEISYRQGKLTVEPKTVTFDWTAEDSYTYNGNSRGIYAAVNGLENGDVVTVGTYVTEGDTIRNTAINVGDYTAKVEKLAGAAAVNYVFDSDTAIKEWHIIKADNAWTIEPSIQGWTEGQTPNTPVAAAKFGTQIKYTYAQMTDDTETPDFKEEQPTTAGTYIMKAVLEGTDNYGGLEKTVEFTVSGTSETVKPVLYITAADTSIEYGEALDSVTAGYTDKDGNKVSINEGDLSGDLLYVTNYKAGDSVDGSVGTYVITTTGVTSDVYDIVFVSGILTVEPKEVKLEWSEGSFTYNGTEQSVTAVVSDDSIVGADVVYVSEYDGNTAVNAGSYKAEALALAGSGSQNYKLPENAASKWKIEKAENAFVVSPVIDGWTYGDDASTPDAAARFGTVTFKYKEKKDGIADWGIFNPATSKIPTEAGTYVLVAEVAADKNGNYDAITSTETTFTISPAQVIIIVSDASSVYGGQIADMKYTLNVIKGRITSEDEKSLNIQMHIGADENSGVGVYPITAVTKANANINVSTIDGYYRVMPGKMTVNAEDVTAVYDGNTHGLGDIQVTAGGKKLAQADVYYSTAELDGNNYGSGEKTSPTLIDAGEQTVYYYVTADNYTPVMGSRKVKVKPAQVTVTAENASVTYGDAATDGGVTFKGFVGDDDENSLGIAEQVIYTYADNAGASYAAGSVAGIYRIIPEITDAGQHAAANYSFNYIEGKLTVDKKALTDDMFAVDNAVLTYDKTAKTPAVKAQNDAYITAGDYTVTYTNNVNAGENTAVITVEAAADGNYSGKVVKKFIILPKPITITANAAESKYRDGISALSYAVTSGSIENGDDLKIKAVTSVKKGYAVGVYNDAVTVSYDTGNTNYSVTVVPADYTVKNGTLSVYAEGYKGVYDGKAHSASVTAKTGEAFVSAEIFYSDTETVDENNYKSMGSKCPTFTDAGTHNIYYYIVCDNYEPVSGVAVVDIAKAPLTVTAPNVTLTYGAEKAQIDEMLDSLSVNDAYTCEGFVGSDKKESVFAGSRALFTTAYTRYMKAGNYSVVITPDSLYAANYELNLKPGLLTVEPKQITFTWDRNTTFEYNGNEQGIRAEINGIVNNDDVYVGLYAEDTAGRKLATAASAGRYTAVVEKLSGSKADNYTFDASDSSASCEWEIAKADNSFVIEPSIGSWTEGSEAASPVAAAKYGEVTFTYSDSEDGTYTEEIPDSAKAGTYWMKASVAESANYKGIEQKVTFEIKQKSAEQISTVIVTAKPVSLTYGDEFDTALLGWSDVTISGLADDISLEDIVNDADGLTFLTSYTKGSSAGSYIVAPKGLTVKDEYADKYEIIYVSGKVSVDRKEISLIWSTPLSFVYDGEVHTVTASVDESQLENGDSIEVTAYESNTVEGRINSAVKTGKYTAHAIGFTGNNSNNYRLNPVSASVSWSIVKADLADGNSFLTDLTIRSWTYGEQECEPECTAKYGTVKYVYSDKADGVYTENKPSDAGNWYVKAVVDETDDYAEIESDAVAFEIRKAKVTIAADDITSAYGSDIGKLTYKVSGTIKSGDDLGIKIATTAVKGSEAGEYPITITYKSNSNYDVSVIEGTYFITENENGLLVTAGGYAGVYDGQKHGIKVDVKAADGTDAKNVVVYYSESELTDANYGSGSTTGIMMTNAGSRKIYYYVTADNCKPVAGSQDIVITQKDVVVTAQDAAITYGEKPANDGVVYDGFIGDDNEVSLGLKPEYTYSYAQYQNAGTYEIIPGGLPTDGNYSYVYKPGRLKVGKKAISFTWSDTELVYDGNKKGVTATAAGIEPGDLITINYEGNTEIHVGSYTAQITSIGGSKADSYTFDNEPTTSVEWSIAKADNYLTTGLAIDDWTYGETASVPRGEVAFGKGKFVYSDSRYGTYTDDRPTEVGTYFMKLVADGNDDYNAFESISVEFEIKAIQLVIAADDISGVVGSDIKKLTYTISGNVVDGEEPDVEIYTTATSSSPAGDYPIKLAVTYNGNYSVKMVEGVYHLTDADIDFKAENVSCVYDGFTHGIKASIAENSNAEIYYSTKKISNTSAIAENPNASKSVPVITNAGTMETFYYVVVDGAVLFKGSKTVTINKANLTVTANDAAILMGEEPDNAGVTYAGFVDGEDESELVGTLKFTYGYKKGDRDGKYTIIPSGLASANYNLIYRAGTLTVTAVQKTVEIVGVEVQKDLVYDGRPHEGFDGTPKTSGNEVFDFEYVYKDADGNVIEGMPTDAGTYTVTISVPKNNAYYKGSKEFTFTIAKKAITITARNQAILNSQTFKALAPEYSGFIGDDNKDNLAIKYMAVVGVDADADLTKAGKVALRITDVGELSDAAAKNYEISNTVDGVLTVIEKVTGSDEKPSTGGSVKLDSADSGIVQTAVIKNQERLPETELETNLTVPVAEALLDDDEIDAVKSGADALIYLILSEVDMAESGDAVDAIEEKIKSISSDAKLGVLLDLSLFKKVGDKEPQKITETGATEVTVYVTLPNSLRVTDSKVTRTYYIVYEHEGETGVITPELDGNVLSFKTSRFSTYAIAYKDVKKSGGGDKPSEDETTSGNETTGDNETTGGNETTGSDETTGGNETTGGDETTGGSETTGGDETTGGSETTGSGETTEAETSSSAAGTASGSGSVMPSGGGTTSGEKTTSEGEKATGTETSSENASETESDAGQESTEKESQSETETSGSNTVTIKPSDDIPSKVISRFEDAIDLIKKLDKNIQAGPYLKPDVKNITDGDEDSVTMIFNVPDELKKDGRIFYLFTVDENGNVVVLENKSIEDGVISVTGKSDATYRVIYEDGGNILGNMISEDGTLVDADGNVLKVTTERCIMHWFILIITLLGMAALIILGRKRKLAVWIILAVTAVVDTVLAVFGTCILDWIFTVIGIMLIAVLAVIIYRGHNNNNDSEVRVE